MSFLIDSLKGRRNEEVFLFDEQNPASRILPDAIARSEVVMWTT